MKRRIFPLAVLLLLLLSVSAQAVGLRAIRSSPSLTFDGTIAICSVDCKSGNSKDKLSVTLTLWQGNTQINSWSDSGTGRVIMSEQCTVKKGQSYKLTLSYSVNGQAQSSVSVSARC